MLVLIHVAMEEKEKKNQITHWWANFSLKTRLSGFTSISLIREREREKVGGERDIYIIRKEIC